MMKISVIVPVYNTENYLKRCLDSLVNQSLKDIEIIIINDGSQDNSQLIIDEYTKKHKNIYGYKKDNGGMSSARNMGLTKANGEFIAFVDSDDYIDKNALKKMYEKAKKDNLDIVVCDSVNVYEDGKKEYIHSNLHYSKNDIYNYIIAPPMACTRIFKKEVFNKVKFKEGIFYEDLELVPSLISVTTKVGFIEEGLYYYFQRNGSIMRQKNFSKKLLDIFDVLDSIKNKIDNNLYKDELEYLYITHLLRTATLRFLEYKNTKEYLNKIVYIMKENYPNYKNNPYFQKSSKKLRTLCHLAYHKKWWLLRLIKKLTNK